jgi:excisionase family DNA binding protein
MPLLVQDYRFFTIQEIAAALRVTPQTVRGYVKQGRLKAQRIGRPLLIPEESLRDFLGIDTASTSSNITLQK